MTQRPATELWSKRPAGITLRACGAVGVAIDVRGPAIVLAVVAAGLSLGAGSAVRAWGVVGVAVATVGDVDLAVLPTASGSAVRACGVVVVAAATAEAAATASASSDPAARTDLKLVKLLWHL